MLQFAQLANVLGLNQRCADPLFDSLNAPKSPLEFFVRPRPYSELGSLHFALDDA